MRRFLQLNGKGTAFKYGHPGLRQLAHRIAYGKISKQVHPHRHSHDTYATYFGKREMRKNWTDTMLILACGLVRILI